MEWLSSYRPSSNIEFVFPVKNELSRLSRLLSHYSDFDLVFIDDTSTDGSLEYLLQSPVSVVKRDRLHEPSSTAPTEAAVITYLNTLSLSRIIVKLDADEFIDPLYFPLFHHYNESSNLQLIKKRIDIHYGKEYCFYPSSQPLILQPNNYISDFHSIHAALTPTNKSSALTIQIPVIHDGNPVSYNRLKKLLHYVNEERLESRIVGKSYFFFVLTRYFRPLLFFPFKQVRYLFLSPRFFFFSCFLLFLELLLAVFFLVEPKPPND